LLVVQQLILRIAISFPRRLGLSFVLDIFGAKTDAKKKKKLGFFVRETRWFSFRRASSI
jgi:hypothetical protein